MDTTFRRFMMGEGKDNSGSGDKHSGEDDKQTDYLDKGSDGHTIESGDDK